MSFESRDPNIFFFYFRHVLCAQQLLKYQDSKMKSGYKTIPQEEESKPLTKAGIAEMGGSRITKKHLVLVSLSLVIMGFLVGHLTNTHHSGLRMSQESMTAQLVDSKEEDVSTPPPP